MNRNKLTPEQEKDFGCQIKGSRYVRDFCSECQEPIRVPSGKLLKENFCHSCDGHLIKGRHFSCDIRHTKDYDNPDIDSGFIDFVYPSDSMDKRVRPENYSDEI